MKKRFLALTVAAMMLLTLAPMTLQAAPNFDLGKNVLMVTGRDWEGPHGVVSQRVTLAADVEYTLSFIGKAPDRRIAVAAAAARPAVFLGAIAAVLAQLWRSG